MTLGETYMSKIPRDVTGYATIALGASQALTPRQAAKTFGMGDINDGNTIWLARLLGAANIAVGTAALNPATRDALRPQTLALLGANAAITATAAAKGQITPRTAASVLTFIAALLPGTLAHD